MTFQTLQALTKPSLFDDPVLMSDEAEAERYMQFAQSQGLGEVVYDNDLTDALDSFRN